MATVKMIAPTAQKPQVLRVAAYCRVSSDSADQLHSYAAQIRAYTDLIRQHDGWELVDIYADEGLTGTCMDKREEFRRLLSDCSKGKIDKVLVKSISRFARNTRDCLASLRELKSLGVSVRFEQENIDTETLTTELMVSVSGSLAQQESVSISENMRMSYQRRMQRGEFITCKAPFGYRLVDGKRLEIIPEEAEVVRWMFRVYLDGYSMEWITAQLNLKGIPTVGGKNVWKEPVVCYMLSNEKYIGDTLCQKTLSTDFPYIKRRNYGEKDQYAIRGTHPAIIPRDVFERAKKLRENRAMREKKEKIEYPLTKKVICAHCGSTFIRRHTRNYVSWVCGVRDKKAENCPVGRIAEEEIQNAFVRMYNKLKENESAIFQPALKRLQDLEMAMTQDDPAMKDLNEAIAKATEQSYKISKLQVMGILDMNASVAKQAVTNAKLNQLRAKRQRIFQNNDIHERVEAIRDTLYIIQNGVRELQKFDEELFQKLVEKIIVESQATIRFQLHGGIKLTESVQGARR